MRKTVLSFLFVILAAACTSRDVGPYAKTDDDKRIEKLAAGNAMCAIENQKRCDHLIENRILFSRFFAPEAFGGMDEAEKYRGRRLTTKFVAEALSEIKQCNRVSDESVIIFERLELDGRIFTMKGTSPLEMQKSTCFITPQSEAS